MKKFFILASAFLLGGFTYLYLHFHISDRERASLCLEVQQALSGAAPQMFAMAFNDATDAEMDAFGDQMITKVAEAHGLEYADMLNICGEE